MWIGGSNGKTARDTQGGLTAVVKSDQTRHGGPSSTMREVARDSAREEI